MRGKQGGDDPTTQMGVDLDGKLLDPQVGETDDAL